MNNACYVNHIIQYITLPKVREPEAIWWDDRVKLEYKQFWHEMSDKMMMMNQ